MSSWKDSGDIKYFVKDAPIGIEKKEIEAVLDRAYSMWAEHIGKPIIRTTDSSIADILVKFDFLDGKGGTLGQSQFPPYISSQTKPIHLVFDKYDVYGSLEGAVFDFFFDRSTRGGALVRATALRRSPGGDVLRISEGNRTVD